MTRVLISDDEYEIELCFVEGDKATGWIRFGRTWQQHAVPVEDLRADSAIELEDAVECGRVHPLDRRPR